MKFKKIKRILFSSKSSQIMGMGFNMIFSIILIIFFIVVAFLVIRHFLNLKNCSEIGIFYDNLQNDINEIWKEQSQGQKFIGTLPSKIRFVCFVDFSRRPTGNSEIYNNLKRYKDRGTIFIWPPKSSCKPVFLMRHINITQITSIKNPYCIKNKKGKIELELEKSYYESLVKIK